MGRQSQTGIARAYEGHRDPSSATLTARVSVKRAISSEVNGTRQALGGAAVDLEPVPEPRM